MAKPDRTQVAILISADVVERARNAVYYSPGVTFAELVERGLEYAVKQLERKHGGPFPRRGSELKRGRRVKV